MPRPHIATALNRASSRLFSPGFYMFTRNDALDQLLQERPSRSLSVAQVSSLPLAQRCWRIVPSDDQIGHSQYHSAGHHLSTVMHDLDFRTLNSTIIIVRVTED